MIYKDFFLQTSFDEVWSVLSNYYHEPQSLKKEYQKLYNTILTLPIDIAHSSETLKVVSDFENMVHIDGAPDPIEWLIGREVLCEPSSEIAGHLLYWSTLYSFKTQRQYQDEFIRWIRTGNLLGSMESYDEALSSKRKLCYYWKDIVAYDSAIDWSYILNIISKRIEYHIGYHRYTDRFTNSKHYVSRMKLSCKLLDIASSDYSDLKDIYVNTHNEKRFIGQIYHGMLTDTPDCEYIIQDLRRAKAYKIVWKFLDHNLSKWWD